MGLLAGVFSDGIVRIFDIREEWIGSKERTTNISVSEAAWKISIGDEFLATCVAWKSHTEIVVGCSNGNHLVREKLTLGFVAIFDLSDDSEDCNFLNLEGANP